MVIIKNDLDVKDPTEQNLSIIATVAKQYPVTNDVHLFETIHGHIAKLKIADGRFVPGSEDGAARMDKEDLIFLAGISFSIRWIELSNGWIQIGLKS